MSVQKDDLEKFIQSVFPEAKKASSKDDRHFRNQKVLDVLTSIYLHITEHSEEKEEEEEEENRPLNTLREIYHEMPPDIQAELVRSLAESLALGNRLPRSFCLNDWVGMVWGNKNVRDYLIKLLACQPGYERVKEIRIETVATDKKNYSVFLNPTPLNLLPYVVRQTSAGLYVASSGARTIVRVILNSNGIPRFPTEVIEVLKEWFKGCSNPDQWTLVWGSASVVTSGVPTVDEIFEVVQKYLKGSPHHSRQTEMSGLGKSGRFDSMKTAAGPQARRIRRV